MAEFGFDYSCTCDWLGSEFRNPFKKEKLFSAKTVLDGVKEHHK